MVGGAIGSALRYGLALWMQGWGLAGGFPWWTLAANVLGSFAIGLVMAGIQTGPLSENARLFLAVGVLGGFTTFSSFSYETLAMIEQNRWDKAMLYVSLSVVFSLLAVWLAYRWTRG